MRKFKVIAPFLIMGFGLVAAFQNFSVPDKTLPDIRDLAPQKPNGYFDQRHVLSAPDQADSAISAGTKWLEREARPLVAPIEKEWMVAVNSRLNRFFKFETVRGEDWPEPGQDDDSNGGAGRAPASEGGGLPNMPSFKTLPDGSPDPESFKNFLPPSDQSSNSYIPRSVRLTKANQLTFDFEHGTDFSCEVGGGGSTFVLSKPLSGTSSINLSHETAENKNSMHFRLSW